MEGGSYSQKDREGKRVLTFEGKVDNRQPRQFLLKKVVGEERHLNQEGSSPQEAFRSTDSCLPLSLSLGKPAVSSHWVRPLTGSAL